jgi:hypothetical protein
MTATLPVFFRTLRIDKLRLEFSPNAAWYLPGIPEDKNAGMPAAFRTLEHDLLRIVCQPDVLDHSLSNRVILILGPSETRLVAQPQQYTPSGPLSVGFTVHEQSLKFRQSLGAWYLGIHSLRIDCILPMASSAHEALARLSAEQLA